MKHSLRMPLLVLLMGLLLQHAQAQTNCSDLIYVSQTGTATAPGTIGNPTNLANALTLVTATKHHIKLLNGVYNFSVTLSLPTNTVLDGGYEIGAGGEWIKNSALTTELRVNAPLTTSAGNGHYIAVRLNGVTDVYIKDLDITNTRAVAGTSNSRGRSAYGIHVANSSNFFFSRLDITSPSASTGAVGATGATGAAGTAGRLGHRSDDDGTNCGGAGGTDDGNGGNGAGGAVGGAGAVTCNGTTTGSAGAAGSGSRNGGAGGGGGAGGRDDGTVARGGGRGGNGGAGAGGGAGAPLTPYQGNGDDGVTGRPGNTGGAGTNGTNATATPPAATFGQFFVPGGQGARGADATGGAGGGGGAGGTGHQGTFINDGSGAGGGGGGGGGQGGTGGFGGFGGGGSFGIYAETGNTPGAIQDIAITVGTAGAGGAGGFGGTGGFGGNGGSGGAGSGEVGGGGRGGNGGRGGTGGRGRQGASGVNAATRGVTRIGTSIPNPQTVTAAMFGGCTNSEIVITKAGGTWGTLTGSTYINDLTQTTSTYNNTSATAIVGYNATGHYDLTIGGTAYESFIYIRDNRPLPGFASNMNPTVCEGDAFVMNTTVSGAAEYEWIIFEDGNNTGTPDALFTTRVASWPTPVTGSTVSYHARLRVRDECCGWSVPTYFSFDVIAAGVGPTVNADTVCAGEAGMLTATLPTAGNVSWFSDALGQITLATGPSPFTFTTPILNQTTVFYAGQGGTGCPGSLTTAEVVVNQLPNNPTANPVAVCAGDNVILTATGSGTGDLVFYNSSNVEVGRVTMTATNPVGTFNAGALGVGTYGFFVAEDNGTCVSNTTAISAVVNALPAAPTGTGTTICAGEDVNLTANGTGLISWYSDAALTTLVGSGNAYTTPILTATTNYFITQTDTNTCESVSATVTVTVNPNPVDPTGTGATICAGQTATLTATNAGGTTNWYADATATVMIGTGTSFTTPALTQNETYYVQETAGTGCVSNTVPVTATVNPLPPTPSTSPVVVCSGANVILTATGSGTGDIVFFDNTNTVVATVTMSAANPTATFNAGALAAGNYLFYASENDGTCVSPVAAIGVTVNALPAAPTAAGVTICSGEDANLMATATGVVNWYDAAALTNLVATGSMYNTGVLTTSTDYFATQVDTNGCESAATTVAVTVNPLPVDPTAAGVTICSGVTASLTATNAGGTTNWYSDATGSTLAGTGASFTTPVLTQTTTYYVQEVSAQNCVSGLVAVTVTVNPLPAAPIAVGTSICTGSTATLMTTASGTVNWYDDAALTNLVATGGSFTTPSLTATTDYYVTTTDANGCVSNTTVVTVTVNALPAAPTATGVTICSGEDANLMATATGVVNWYDAAALTNLVATGSMYNTGVLTASTDYFATQVDTNGCESAATTVAVTVNPLPVDPTAAGVTICSGVTASLTATNAGGTTNWYSDATGSTLAGTGASFTTPVLTQTTTYYVQEVSAQNCVSGLVAVTVTVNPLPAAPIAVGTSICTGSTATLMTTASGTVNWYDDAVLTNLVATGGSFTTPSLTATTDYYVTTTDANGCVSNTTVVTVTVNALPAAPTAAGVTICSGEDANLMATATGTVNWYSDAALTNLVATGSMYNTGVLTASTDYFATQVDTNGCESAATTVAVTVNPLPVDPTAAGVTICSGVTASLTATNAGGTTNWYSDATGSTLAGTGASFTTPVLTQTTTYYVQEVSAQNCVSGLVAVTVTVNPLPAAPIAVGTSICTGSTASLMTTASGTVNWYDDAALTNLVATGGSFTTPSLTATTDYYVTTTDANGCVSNTTVVTVTVNALPAAPTATGVTICSGEDANLMATATGTVNWYSDAALTNLVATGSMYNTGVLTTSTDYFATQVDTNGCESAATTVAVTVNPLPVDPTAAGVTICSGVTASLTATNAGGTTNWYSDATGSTLAGTGASFTTPVLTQTTTYYVQEVSAQNCVSGLVAVTVTVNPLPAAPIAVGTSICTGSTATLMTTASGTVNWYDDAALTNLVATGGSFTTPSLTATTDYYITTTDANGCVSNTTVVTVTVNALPAAPTATGVTICSGEDANLMATATGTVNWYSDAALTNLVATGSMYNTGVLTTSTDYFATQVDTNGCESAATTVAVTVNPLPVDPTAAGVTICSGVTASLTATNAGGTTNWYSDATGSTLAGTGASFTTPVLTQTTTYYVQEVSAQNCVSGLVAVTVTVNPLPAAPIAVGTSICTGSTATLMTTASGTVNWYDDAALTNLVATGGSFTTPSLTATTDYYITTTDANGCVSNTTVVTVTVNALPAAPTATGVTICSGEDANLMATATGTVNWYSDAALTNLVATGSMYNTGVLTASTDYFATQVDTNGCESAATTVAVTVNPLPVDPTAAGVTICSGVTASLTATNAGGTTNWYSDATGSTLAGTGASFTTPVLTQTTTYYVQEVSAQNCVSGLVAVTVTVNPLPAAPIAVGTSICTGSTASLMTTASGTVNWYDDAALTNLVATGGSFTTPSLTATTDYYVTTTDANGCVSNTTVVTVTVNALPAAPTIANDTICAGTMSTLMTGTAVNWYADAAGTVLLTTSSSYTTGMLNADTMIFATITDANGCESTTDTVMITVNPAPVAPTVVNDTICAGSGASLTATTSGGTINWYSDPAGANLVNTGTTYTIPFLNQTTSYYIREVNTTTGCEGAWTIATVVVNPQPLAPSAADIEICSGSDVILTATGSGIGDLVFYDASNTEVGRFTMSAGNTTGTFNVGALAIGNYVYYVAEDNGDCSSALTAINVEVKQLPAAPTALNDSPVCEGEIVFVQASTITGAVYNWTGPNGFSSSLQNFSLANITTAEAGVYTVNVSIDGCVSANGSTTVTVNPAPVFTGSITSNSPLCEYETLNLAAPTASGNIAYLWTGPLGFAATGQNISIPTVSEVDNQGFYNVSVIDGTTGCTSAPLSTLVMITSLPDGGMASNNSPVCDGANAVLSVQEVFGATYNWSGPNGFSSTDREAIVSVSNIDTGLYTVTVTVNSCSSTYDTYVSMYPKPTIIASADTTIEVGQSLQLFATGAVQYRWTPGDYLDFTTIFNPVMTPDMIGSYTYTVIGTSIYGCDNSEEVEVTVVPEVIDPADVRIVDLFTPNGDGINDTWIVDYLQQASVSNYTLQIITRAGLEVLNTQNYSNDWDGTYNGQPLPDGTYWYIITQDDGTVLKGAVTLKR